MTNKIQTLDDQLALIEVAFDEARNHPKPIGIDGLPFLRVNNRWWDVKDDTEQMVAQFTDVHSADDEPQALRALINHTKDRVKMSITSDTDSVLLRILIKFQTREQVVKEPTAIVQDRFLVEFQWIMPLAADGVGAILGGEEDDPLARTPNEILL